MCEWSVIDGKDQALYCEEHCKSWFHRYCAGVSVAHFFALSSFPDPFLCVVCFQDNSKNTMLELKSTISTGSEM